MRRHVVVHHMMSAVSTNFRCHKHHCRLKSITIVFRRSIVVYRGNSKRLCNLRFDPILHPDLYSNCGLAWYPSPHNSKRKAKTYLVFENETGSFNWLKVIEFCQKLKIKYLFINANNLLRLLFWYFWHLFCTFRKGNDFNVRVMLISWAG